MDFCAGNSEIRYGTIFPHTQGVLCGDTITISCYSAALTKWKYYGDPIYPRRFGNTIFIHNAAATDTGEYECEGKLPDGASFNSYARVYVASKLCLNSSWI